MSTASNRPSAPRLNPEGSNESRTRTMTRLKETSMPEDAGGSELGSGPEAGGELPAVDSNPESAPPSGPGHLPEALRKPYASLLPQKPSAEPAKPSLPPSKRSESRRWTDTTEARRRAGTCAKHGIARSPSGECMLCKKDEAKQKRSALPLVIGGLVIATLLFYGWLYLL